MKNNQPCRFTHFELCRFAFLILFVFVSIFGISRHINVVEGNIDITSINGKMEISPTAKNLTKSDYNLRYELVVTTENRINLFTSGETESFQLKALETRSLSHTAILTGTYSKAIIELFLYDQNGRLMDRTAKIVALN